MLKEKSVLHKISGLCRRTCNTHADTSLSSSSSDYEGKKELKSEINSEKTVGKTAAADRKKIKRVCVCFCGEVCEAHRSIDIHDHLPSGLVAFAVVGSFLFLLQHPVTGGPVLQCKLAEDFTKPVDADVSHTVGRMTEVQQEGVEPGKTPQT